MNTNYKSIILVISLIFALSAPISAAPGDLDPTFSGDGKLIDGTSHSGENANAVAIQADGKIVVAGSGYGSGTIARYNPDGSLDATFGNDGWIAGCSARAVAIQGDGKIVVGCTVDYPFNADFAVARYNPDGSLDTSFGIGGGVTTSFTSGRDQLKSIAIQSDGKIVAAGSIDGSTTAWWTDRFAVARYNADGSLDTTFAGDGTTITVVGAYHRSAYPSSVAIQSDGKIIVVGSVYLGPATGNPVEGYGRVLIRYRANGAVDASFDADGIVTTSPANGNCGDIASSVAIQADGKIVVAGTGCGFRLTRYNINGSLDTTFGGGGSVVTPIGTPGYQASAQSLVIQSDGKIVAAGKSYAPTTGSGDTDLAVARYNSDGSLDTSFDGDGIVTTPVNQVLSEIHSVALQPDGRIVGVGFRSSCQPLGDCWSSYDDFLVARYNDNGSLDTAFDSDGIVITDFLSGSLRDVAVQTDGKIVAVGSGLVRYNPDGTRDTTFGGGTGRVDLLSGFSNFGGDAVVIQADGKIIVAGTESCGEHNETFGWLARFDQAGSFDRSFGGDGFVSSGGCDDSFTSVAIQSDGKIVAGGRAQVVRYNPDGSLDTTFGGGDGSVNTFSVAAIAIGSNGKIAIAGSNYNGSDLDFMTGRLNSDGSFDTAFDGDGTATTPFGPGNDLANSVVIQPDGKIVAAGTSFNGSNNDFAVVRYNANGSLDTTFNSNGIVTTPVGPGYDAASSVAIGSDGKLVAAGSSSWDSGATLERDLPAYFALVRYNTNGSLDTTFGGGDGKTTIAFSYSNDQANGMALDGQGRAVVVGQSGGAFAIARVLGDSTPTCPNPIDCADFFVRQHYLDFLNREPDPLSAQWVSLINSCPPGDTTCDRVHVSSAFFQSPEFQQRGYFLYRFYPVALGRKPDYDEFIPDLAKVSGFLNDAELEAAKVAFITEFMTRPAFVTKFDGLSNTDYVDALLATAGITHPARDFWIAALGNGTRTRAQVLREIAESGEVYYKYYNQAFVVMQYFGYLRRQPDALYLNWIAQLEATGDYRSMIEGFINSVEYRARFGP